jgi:AraC-like DNA-binding protein
VIVAIILALPILLQLRVESGALVSTGSLGWMVLLPPAAILATLGYPVAALARLHAHRRRLKRRLSNLHKTDLAWARAWAITTIALLLTQFAVFVISLTGALPVPVHVALLLAAQTLQVAFVGWHGLTQSQVFRFEPTDDDASRAGPRDLEMAREDLEVLRAFMLQHQPHRDPDLTAGGLADRLGWAPYRLTQALRLGGSTNFHDFVNRARVEAVKKDVLDPKHANASLLALAFDAGFGSKSAFYEVFRAVEGVAPARWRARNVTR